jgi:hypothetical protein
MDEGKIEAFISDIISKFCVEQKSGSFKFRRKDIITVDGNVDFVFSDKLRGLIFDFFGTSFELENEKLFSDIINSIKVSYKRKRKGAFTIRSHNEIYKFLFSLWVEMITGIRLYENLGKFQFKNMGHHMTLLLF